MIYPLVNILYVTFITSSSYHWALVEPIRRTPADKVSTDGRALYRTFALREPEFVSAANSRFGNMREN
jgi:hypothetical protein